MLFNMSNKTIQKITSFWGSCKHFEFGKHKKCPLIQQSANSGSRPKFGLQRLRAWVAKVLNVQPTNRYSTLNLGELGHFEGRPQQQFQGCRTPYFQRWLN